MQRSGGRGRAQRIEVAQPRQDHLKDKEPVAAGLHEDRWVVRHISDWLGLPKPSRSELGVVGCSLLRWIREELTGMTRVGQKRGVKHQEALANPIELGLNERRSGVEKSGA